MNRATMTTAALLIAGLTFPGTGQAQVPGGKPVEGRQFALLIGVEKYEKAAPLVYTINDVKTLASTLRQRDGVTSGGILEMTDEASDPRYRPSLASMKEEIPRWLAKIGPNDRLLVYFSGHGFKDPGGNLYLAPIDIDPADPSNTGLRVEWLRQQIADCKAEFKLLVLDACHAGTEKSPDKDRQVSSEQLGSKFKGLERVATLASSTALESSQPWDDKQMSLYTYWFNQALKGHADVNSNGSVDINEISDYVYENVRRTVKYQMMGKQTPVRSFPTGIEGTPVVVQLMPIALKTLLKDISEQLSMAATDKKLKKVGVLEFSSGDARMELVGASFGSLGKVCSEWMMQYLANSGDLQVTSGSALMDAVIAANIGPSDLGNPEKMQKLSKAMQGLPGLIKGEFLSRSGRVLSVHCKLQETEGTDLVGSAGGTAILNESEWAMLGRSGVLSAADVKPARPTIDTIKADPQDASIAKLDQKSQEIHPLANPNFEFPVRIMVDGVERPGSAKGNAWIVPLKKGDKYQIYLGNNSGRPICARVLVDGLNTQLDLYKAQTKGVATYSWGQPVSLAEANHWILDPADPRVTDKPKVWGIPGFATETGEKGKVRPFIMGTAEQSLAGKRKYTKDLGLITVAFYEASPIPVPRSVGTIAGDETGVQIPDNVKLYPAALRAVVNIRYVDADEPVSSEFIDAIQGPPPTPSVPQQ